MRITIALACVWGSSSSDVPKGAEYRSFSDKFPHDKYNQFVKNIYASLGDYKNSAAYTAYDTIQSQPHCDPGSLSGKSAAALSVRKISHGEESVPIFGMDVAGHVAQEFSAASGPAAAQAPAVGALASTALQQVKGILQTVAAVAATDIPPLVAPPAWNNQPFPCLPMVTGHNCFGAVPHPITIGDFVLADVTDSALDAVVADFPSLYREKVGKTDDATYEKCFSAYMSMQCANAFPMCTNVQGRELGRAPMCFVHCVATLVACPGLWVDDISSLCQDVSAPPVCAMAFYNKPAPPQLATYDEEVGYPLKCPQFDPELDTGLDASVMAKSVRGGLGGETSSAPFPSSD